MLPMGIHLMWSYESSILRKLSTRLPQVVLTSKYQDFFCSIVVWWFHEYLNLFFQLILVLIQYACLPQYAKFQFLLKSNLLKVVKHPSLWLRLSFFNEIQVSQLFSFRLFSDVKQSFSFSEVKRSFSFRLFSEFKHSFSFHLFFEYSLNHLVFKLRSPTIKVEAFIKQCYSLLSAKLAEFRCPYFTRLR